LWKKGDLPTENGGRQADKKAISILSHVEDGGCGREAVGAFEDIGKKLARDNRRCSLPSQDIVRLIESDQGSGVHSRA